MPDIQVTNHNDFPLVGRFAGRDYTFPAHKAVSAPEAAVIHIFGMNDDNKTGAYNRLGLLRPGSGTIETAKQAFDNVQFVMGRTVFDDAHPMPQPADDQQPIGGAPGASWSPGGEPEVGEAQAAAPTAGALTRDAAIARRRRAPPSGG